MNTNQIQQNDATNQSKKPAPFRTSRCQGGENDTVTFNVPIRFYTSPGKSETKIIEDIQERIRLNISGLAEYIKYLSNDMMMQKSDDSVFVEGTCAFFIQLAEMIEGYTELIEELEIHKSWEPEDEPPAADLKKPIKQK